MEISTISLALIDCGMLTTCNILPHCTVARHVFSLIKLN